MRRLIPEWQEPAAVVLAWVWHEERKSIHRTYRRLISSLPASIQTILLTNGTLAPKDPGRELADLVIGRGGYCHIVPSLRDIWIKDWAPVPVCDENGAIRMVKARYFPHYLSPRAAKGDHDAGLALAKKVLDVPLRRLRLKWDFGNITHNGKGVAIVTKRLVEDNPGLDESRMRALLRTELGISNLVLVDVEPKDETGHIDGMVRFVAEDTVLVGAYPRDYESSGFMNRVAEKIREKLGPGMKIHRMPNLSAERRKTYDGIWSAFGNYINFLRLGNQVWLPQYGGAADLRAAEAIRKALPQAEVIGVHATEIAREGGGVLNCMTWVLPKKP